MSINIPSVAVSFFLVACPPRVVAVLFFNPCSRTRERGHTEKHTPVHASKKSTHGADRGWVGERVCILDTAAWWWVGTLPVALLALPPFPERVHRDRQNRCAAVLVHCAHSNPRALHAQWPVPSMPKRAQWTRCRVSDEPYPVG